MSSKSLPKAKVLFLKNSKPSIFSDKLFPSYSKLAIAIRKDFPDFYPYFSRTSFNWKGHKFRNHNKLLSSNDLPTASIISFSV